MSLISSGNKILNYSGGYHGIKTNYYVFSKKKRFQRFEFTPICHI